MTHPRVSVRAAKDIRFNGPKSPQYNIQKPKKTGQNTTKFWTQGPTTKTLRDKQGSAAARTNAAAPTSPSLRNTIGEPKVCEAKQGTPSPPGSRPTTAELTKPPPLGDRNRRRRSWRSLRLPETKPNSRTMSFTAPSSTRPRLYARDRSAMGGLVPELRQNRGERERERSEDQQL
ncbi:unnamed protein product [Brassica napus]|nr:unnamed protein product [Brassica napus]